MIYLVNLFISIMVKIKKNSDDNVIIDEKLFLFLRNYYHNESTGHDLITCNYIYPYYILLIDFLYLYFFIFIFK
jgi:hypothetical protein